MRTEMKNLSWMFLTALALAIPSAQALARDDCPDDKIGCLKVFSEIEKTAKELGLDSSAKSQPKIDLDIDNPFENGKRTQRREQNDW